MSEEEIEKTFLISSLPQGIEALSPIELLDVYIPEESTHPKLRLRKRGENYEITKKILKNESDLSIQIEQTIPLTQEEFEAISSVSGKKIRKLRYTTLKNGVRMDLDLFLDALYGLALVDFEFQDNKQKNNFISPNFVHRDVTQEKFIAGGLLAGKSYADIQSKLEDLGYKKLDYKYLIV